MQIRIPIKVLVQIRVIQPAAKIPVFVEWTPGKIAFQRTAYPGSLTLPTAARGSCPPSAPATHRRREY